MIVAHQSHELRKLSVLPPVTAAKPNIVADHRFSEEALVDLLGALHARAAGHPGNPGLVACWPAVPEQQMAAACRVLVGRGHAVRPALVTGWQSDKTRAGWTLVTSAGGPHVPQTRDAQARSDAERWTNEGGSLAADARRLPERSR
jgi:hypothetical protein